MFLFGHLGVTLGLFFILACFLPRFKGRINYWYIAIGALFPDIIDKIIGRVIFSNSIANSRLIAHTLIFSILLTAIGFYIYRRRGNANILLLASASFLHIIVDRIWNNTATFFWPVFGWSFPRRMVHDNWLDYFIQAFRRTYIPDFSFGFIFELVGFSIIMIFILKYLFLKRKMRRNGL